MQEFVLPTVAEGDFKTIARERNAFMQAFGRLQKQWLLKRIAETFRRIPAVEAVEMAVLLREEDAPCLSVAWELSSPHLQDEELWMLKEQEKAMDEIFSEAIADFVDGLTITRGMLLEPNGTVRNLSLVLNQIGASRTQ